MNIFVLDEDPKQAAQYHCNKHVVKMILESAQMLCGAHWYSLLKEQGKTISELGGPKKAKEYLSKNVSSDKIPPYAFTHTGHPCSIWAAENVGNYGWLDSLMRALLDEYTLRYGKRHKSEDVWLWLHDNDPQYISQAMIMTPHPQCMPDECKVLGNTVKAYRNYYIKHKKYLAVWEPRSSTPDWFKEQDV